MFACVFSGPCIPSRWADATNMQRTGTRAWTQSRWHWRRFGKVSTTLPLLLEIKCLNWALTWVCTHYHTRLSTKWRQIVLTHTEYTRSGKKKKTKIRKGNNTLGKQFSSVFDRFSLTLIDTLDTLVVSIVYFSCLAILQSLFGLLLWGCILITVIVKETVVVLMKLE